MMTNISDMVRILVHILDIWQSSGYFTYTLAEDHDGKPRLIQPGEQYKIAQEYLADNG
jgi:hypothetical protein